MSKAVKQLNTSRTIYSVSWLLGCVVIFARDGNESTHKLLLLCVNDKLLFHSHRLASFDFLDMIDRERAGSMEKGTILSNIALEIQWTIGTLQVVADVRHERGN